MNKSDYYSPDGSLATSIVHGSRTTDDCNGGKFRLNAWRQDDDQGADLAS